jgi:hypothetical protein
MTNKASQGIVTQSLLRGKEAGESMFALGCLCGFSHTSGREAIERAREKRDEGN